MFENPEPQCREQGEEAGEVAISDVSKSQYTRAAGCCMMIHRYRPRVCVGCRKFKPKDEGLCESVTTSPLVTRG